MEYLYRPRAVHARATQSPSEIVPVRLRRFSRNDETTRFRRRVSDPPRSPCARVRACVSSPPYSKPRSQGSRPTARGKKRGGRSEDPFARLTRKLDKWIDKNPVLSGLLSVCVVFLLLFLFWQIFGTVLSTVYDTYLKRYADPYVKRVVNFCAPHFVALSDLLGEKRGFVETARRMFVRRDVVLKEL